jgi:RNA polymerase sigma-70 factor (ECF subfamily)
VADLDAVARRAGEGDGAAFRDLVDATRDRLYRLALRLTGDGDEAGDVLQDAYVRAHAALVNGKWKGESKVETWLYRIVLNTGINHRRGRKRTARVTSPMVPAPRSPELNAEVTRLLEAVRSLPRDQHEAVVLKELEGHTSAEIARLLGCTEGAVEQRLVRARANLRARLGHE